MTLVLEKLEIDTNVN